MIGNLDAWKASRKLAETQVRHGGLENPVDKGYKGVMQTREIRLFVLVAVLLAAAVLLSPIALPSRADAA
jgi:hypothetical protein